MSIVGRGLGRRGVAAALIVTAGLGLGQPEIRPDDPRGSGRLADEQLAQIVRSQWELLELRQAAKPERPEHLEPEPAVAPVTQKPAAAKTPPYVALAAQAPAPEVGAVAKQDQLAPAQINNEAALLAMLLQAEAGQVRVTVKTGAPAASDDELALLAALLASDPSMAA